MLFCLRAVVKRSEEQHEVWQLIIRRTLAACVNTCVVCMSPRSRSRLVFPTATSPFIVFRDDTLFVQHGHGKITQERNIGTLIIASEVSDDKKLCLPAWGI